MHSRLPAKHKPHVGPKCAVVARGTPRLCERIKQLADLCRGELGFVVRAWILDSVRRQAVFVARSADGHIIGFVEFRHRRDKVTKLYRICTHPAWRLRGIGKMQIDELVRDCRVHHQRAIVLLCPMGLPANGFYAARGFVNTATRDGRRLGLLEWKMAITSPTRS